MVVAAVLAFVMWKLVGFSSHGSLSDSRHMEGCRILVAWKHVGFSSHGSLSDSRHMEACRILVTWKLVKLFVRYQQLCVVSNTRRPSVQRNIYQENLEKDSKGGRSVEIYDAVGLATLDTMLQCAFSYDGNVQKQGKPWLQWYWVFRLTSEGRKFARLVNYVHEFAESLISRRRKELENDPTLLEKRNLDFLDILLAAKDEHGVGLLDLEIRHECDTFLFEGHDTTSSGLSWAIFCLARYPDYQQMVFEEVNEVMGDRAEVEWGDLPKTPKLTMFLKEVLRMYSPVTGVSRGLTKPVEIDGVVYPADTQISVSIGGMHCHPEVWTDHKTFKPERFLEENSHERDPFSFVPFAAGPRNCIGQNFAMNEMKVIISRVVRRFKVVFDPTHEAIPFVKLILKAEHGIKVYLEDR
ncbi:cytochrome P450 4B1-like [Ylistrum balloti]|uniref:cytochrome P450 4B1-like n=1 Tax=Ylistrum balloti TaxID=509963 RepID=UPI002905EE62|nr:cytochrome P450 4B1-like [Ylistrum balloti]